MKLQQPTPMGVVLIPEKMDMKGISTYLSKTLFI